MTVRPIALACALFAAPALFAEDWPEMQGAGRRSEWKETGILRQFPAEGLKFTWRTEIGGGFSGPAVAGGRVFVSDYLKREGTGIERALCLDEQTGRILWTYENPQVDYSKFTYNTGPRATPTVAGNRVYVLGAAGDLYCLDTATGALAWKVNYGERFGSKMPSWGFVGAPLVYEDLVICPVGGKDNARLVALNAATGETVWKALPTNSDIAYAPPVLLTAAGVPQLVHEAANTVAAVNPRTGEVLWEQALQANIPCATPLLMGDRLFIGDFWKGSTMLRLRADRPGVEVLWERRGPNEVNTDGLHSLMCTPMADGEYIYGVCSMGQLRCLNADDGARVWESMEVVREKARWANAFMVRNGEAYFLVNDRGELIIARLSPQGCQVLSRTQLIAPTSGGAGTRELKVVNWVIPAYANRHIVTRNDQEIVRASLAE